MDNTQAADVIIIGAGMSGMTAAATLSASGYKVLVLEARDRTGGRIHTYTKSQAMGPIDLGASFIHGINGNPLTDIAKTLRLRMIGSKNDLEEGGELYFHGQPVPKNVAQQVFTNMFGAVFDGAVQYAQEETEPASSASMADYLLDEHHSRLFDGLDSEHERELARRMLRGFAGWPGADFDLVSLKYWGFERTFDGIDQLVQDGYHNFISAFEWLVESFGGHVALGKEVTAIEYLAETGDGAVRVSCTSGETYVAPYCVCTLPLGVLQQHAPRFTPPLPPRRLRSIASLGFGLLNKAVINYPSVWWTGEKVSMRMIMPEQRLTDGLPYVNKGGLAAQSYVEISEGKPTLMFYMGGTLGEQVEQLSDEEAAKLLHTVLAENLTRKEPSVDVPQPVETLLTRWRSDPYACGSYSYVRASDDCSPLDHIELGNPLYAGRLGFAGEATEHNHYSLVHGALLSGYREASRIGLHTGKRALPLHQVIHHLQW